MFGMMSSLRRDVCPLTRTNINNVVSKNRSYGKDGNVDADDSDIDHKDDHDIRVIIRRTFACVRVDIISILFHA